MNQSLEALSFQPTSADASPEEYAKRGELNAELQKAIIKLSEDQRTVMVLIDVQGVSYEEAAEPDGVFMGTLESCLNRARRPVRHILLERRELLPERFRQ